MAVMFPGLISTDRVKAIRTALHPYFRSVRDHRHADDVTHQTIRRDPCTRCQVRADLHDQFGCKAYRHVG